MSPSPSEASSRELLPLLVADLADENSRVLLEAVAAAGGEACVPLVMPPMNASPHLLEVYSPETPEALLLMAQPLGPPTPQGFLLRLWMPEPAGDEPSGTRPAERRSYDSVPAVLKPRAETSHKISANHAAALESRPPPAPDEVLVGRLVGGKFAIERLIGTGGMGAVYRAVHRGLQMPVAIKVLHERFQRDLEFCKSFHAEALAASRLDHPNLVRVVDFGQEPDGLLYFTMEFLDGTSLRDLMRVGEAMPLESVVKVMTQVCLGLAHAHARGVVHRDLKPENIVLVQSPDDDGAERQHVKICDFGLAAAGHHDAREISGTPEYMSPEQCSGDEVDGRGDVYACGVMLYELATGKLPFEGPNAMAIVNRHIGVDPVPPSQVAPTIDPRLEHVILKALRKERADRQQSARELRHELQALLSAPVRAADAPPPSQPRQARTEPAPSAEMARPQWLEDNTLSGAFTNVEAQEARSALISLIQDPLKWLKTFAETRDAAAFAKLASALEGSIVALAEEGRAPALCAVAHTVNAISDEGPRTPGSRASAAHRVQSIVLDPSILGKVAGGMLRGDPGVPEALPLLREARVAGAYALYGARLRAVCDADARMRFITAMRGLGENAWPVIRAALQKLEPQIERAPDLVEDLLRGTPDVRDDGAGEIIARLCASHDPVRRAAATLALARAWGERARAMMLGALHDPDDAVRTVAVAALDATRSLDEHVVRKLALILDGRLASSDSLRLRVATSLRNALPPARAEAAALLKKLLESFPATPVPDRVLVAAAESLLLLERGDALLPISECAARCPGALRRQLLALPVPQ